jgi:mannose/cellobiose epimerase-like protein (N-acyl-D-glucosamine 2-epimerase family)
MSLTRRKSLLQLRMRKERKRVNEKYRRLIRQVESECQEHAFGEWHKRKNASTNFYQSNFLGEPFYFRDCTQCGRTESKIERG